MDRTSATGPSRRSREDRSRSRSRHREREHRERSRDGSRSRSRERRRKSSRSRSKDRKRRSRSRSRSKDRKHKHHHSHKHHKHDRRSRSSERRKDAKHHRAPPSAPTETPEDVLKGLFSVLPALREEIRGVLEALDAGESIAVDGVADPLVKVGLVALFVALDLRKEEDNGDGQGVQYSKAPGQTASVLQRLLHLLEPGESAAGQASLPEAADEHAASHATSRALAVGKLTEGSSQGRHGHGKEEEDIGPALPPPRADSHAAGEEEEEDVMGPSLADIAGLGGQGAAPSLPRVGWDALPASERPKGSSALPSSFPSHSRAAGGAAQESGVGRHDWMSDAPAELRGLMGGSGGQASKAAALPARLRIDKTAPGYGTLQGRASEAGGGQGTAGEAGGPLSLLQMHQSKGAGTATASATAAAGKTSALANSGGWKPFDRERDVLGSYGRAMATSGSGKAGGAAEAILKGPSALTSMFTAGTYEKSFL